MSGINVYVMGRLSEVQLLVLLSFILQLFLFFTGGLRRRRRNWLVRSSIWIAYLGADVVAIYALGLLSRHADAIAFLWAPFLLVHVGGQDTITAFAIEDSNLWLRHLLSLLLQVTLALYVLWMSSSWHNMQVLVPGILVFVAGIIKYGERTAALRHGNLNNMVIISTNNTSSSNPISNSNNNSREQQILTIDVICDHALRSAPWVRMLFARRKTPEIVRPSYYDLSSIRHRDLFRLMDVELGLMYSDVYTKAAVLRTKTGIVFRCISLACTIAALILFFFTSSDHHETTNTSSRVDIAITYALFIGGLVVDICSLLTLVMASPWTWAWLLRVQGHRSSRIASMSLRLVSCNMVSGWLGTTARPLWSNTMGQYRFVCYDDDSQPWSSSPPPPPKVSERVMCIIRKLVACSEEEKKLFRLSKLLETKHVVVDDNVTKCLVEATNDIIKSSGGGEVHQAGQQWECLGQLLLAATQPECTKDFVHLICWLHACTEVMLCEAVAVAATTTGSSSADATANADVCRKLSRYMVYLVAAHPAGDALLQLVSSHADKEYKSWERYSNISLRGKQHQIRTGLLRLELEAANKGCGCGSSSTSSRILASSLPRPEGWHRTLEELKRMWARLLVYAAAKSRPEAHAAELARGGELLTFVWLLLCHSGLGADFQVDLVPHHGSSSESSKTYYIFKNLPALQMVVDNCCPQLLLPPPTNKDNCREDPLSVQTKAWEVNRG